MNSGYYILVGQTPVPVHDVIEWAQWFENNPNDRGVKRTRLMDMVDVSTVFLGLDHGFGFLVDLFPITTDPRPYCPVLFESMAFWPGGDSYEQDRCSTWLQAERMHERMCREVMRPSAVWAFCRRRLAEWWNDAKRDWQLGWKELRGISFDRWEQTLIHMRSLMQEES